MSQGYLLGIDIGTYESKGVITDLAGQVIQVQVCPHELLIPHQGWAEHDVEAVWWGDFVTLTRRLLAESGIAPTQIRAVGCSAIGPCVLPVDEACRPLRPGGILYGIDTRAVEEIAELEAHFGRDRIFQQNGNMLSAQSIGPKIRWLKKHEPDIYARAYKFVTSTTFLVARLTGRFVIDQITASFWSPPYNFHTQQWDPRFCEGIVEPERLPDIAWASEIAGTVTAAAARATGLAAGTPVVVGSTDAAAEALSVGVTSPGQMMLMYGSTVFMIQVVAQPTIDERLWAAPYLFPGTFQLAAGMATSGALTRWFRDKLAPDLVAAESTGGANAYSVLTQEATAIPPGAEGLIVLPYFSGERTPINDPQARGLFFGLTLAHTRAHLFRAVLEGIGYGIAQHFQVMAAIGAAPHEVVAVGGGTQSALWLQTVSDISGRPQKAPAVTIGASYGDAFLAGLGVGLFDSYQAIHQWLKDVRTITPQPENTARYAPYLALYLELYQRNKTLMHELGALR
ncbi:MAG: FGGY-family carbohydrate kinase [Caldilineaceae bacterium]|nr:FGGY-family carbohydrate kinase [Caldilineaceae bacterium]